MNTLTPRASWSAIAATISGAERALEIYAGMLKPGVQTNSVIDADLHRICKAIIEEVRRFRNEYHGVISAETAGLIDMLVEAGDKYTVRTLSAQDPDFTADSKVTKAFVLKLVIFAAQVRQKLNDLEEDIRSSSELAFAHLQRMIAVDKEYRGKWLRAFDDELEIGCEKLGSLHLLWHGIHAFKAHGARARTDLIFPEPVERSLPGTRGLVLTEWKRANDDGASAFRQAMRQTDQYEPGILGGFELTSYRYMVIVTKKQIPRISDAIERGITYRFINIAVEPDSPSLAARQLATGRDAGG